MRSHSLDYILSLQSELEAITAIKNAKIVEAVAVLHTIECVSLHDKNQSTHRKNIDLQSYKHTTQEFSTAMMKIFTFYTDSNQEKLQHL